MIRTEAEYERAKQRLAGDKTYIEQLREALEEQGLTATEMERAMEPARSFHMQLLEEVEAYERMRRGQFDLLNNLPSIGRWLIGLRIYRGWTQKRLADALGVSEAQVSKDERNEYHNVSTEKAQRILEVLGASFSMQLEDIEAEDSQGALSRN